MGRVTRIRSRLAEEQEAGKERETQWKRSFSRVRRLTMELERVARPERSRPPGLH